MYRISFECEIMDYTTMELASHADMKDREMNISNGGLPEKAEDVYKRQAYNGCA